MRSEVSHKKQVAGVLYGLAAGLAFAIFAWGLDALQLAAAHGAYYWVKFVPGLVICLAARVDTKNSCQHRPLDWIIAAVFQVDFLVVHPRRPPDHRDL
jgi:hypothetical protein